MEPWWNNLVESCKTYSLEPMQGPDGIVYIVGAKLPDYEIRDKVSKVIPFQQKYEFVRGMRRSTLDTVSKYLEQAGFKGAALANNCDGVLYVNLPINPRSIPESVIRVLEVALMNLVRTYGDDFVTGVTVRLLPSTVTSPKAGLRRNEISAQFSERQESERGYINKDDLLNLKIALGQCGTVDELLRVL